MATWQEFDEEIKNITVVSARYSNGWASFSFRFAHEITEYEPGKWKALVAPCNANIPPAEVTLNEFISLIKNRFKIWRAKLDSEKAVRDVVEGYIDQDWNIPY